MSIVDPFVLAKHIGDATDEGEKVIFIVTAEVYNHETKKREDKVFEFTHFSTAKIGIGQWHVDIRFRFDNGPGFTSYYDEHVELEWHLVTLKKPAKIIIPDWCDYPPNELSKMTAKQFGDEMKKAKRWWKVAFNPDPFSYNSSGYRARCWVKEWPQTVQSEANKINGIILKSVHFREAKPKKRKREKKTSSGKKKKREGEEN
jgi:hypothetical protein